MLGRPEDDIARPSSPFPYLLSIGTAVTTTDI